jgi:hypothetical protein
LQIAADSDKGTAPAMSYRLKLSLYMVAAAVLAYSIGRWLKPLGFVVSIASASVFAYLTIIGGRRIFGRRRL